jgi:hypothetical protein
MIVARIDSYLVQATAKRHGSCWLGCATITPTHDGSAPRHKNSVIHFGLKECSKAAEQAALEEARRHIGRRHSAPLNQVGRMQR